MSAPPPRKRALYVEDDPQCANLVKESLAELCDVDLVRDGFSALDHARQSPPDVLLVDLRLPTLSGFELVEQWRRDADLENVPWVVVSAQVMGAERDRAEELGCAGFVEKPFSLERLRAAVKAALT